MEPGCPRLLPSPVFRGLVLIICVVGGAGRLRAVVQKWVVFSQDLQTYTGIRNSYLLRMKLVVNREFVGAHQEIFCSWVAEEFGNTPSSNAGGLGGDVQEAGLGFGCSLWRETCLLWCAVRSEPGDGRGSGGLKWGIDT